MKRIIIALLLAVIPGLAFAQQRLSGTILDRATHQPIAYCNIGIPEKGVGTVCNELGRFELIVPDELSGDAIVVSHIGYESYRTNIGELTKNADAIKIELQQLATRLPEVAIRASQHVSIGHKPNDNIAKGFFKATGLGMEGGTLIKNEDAMVLTNFHMNILRVPFDSMKFRLNIYAGRKRHATEKLNKRDIVFTITSADTGLYSLPIDSVDIRVASDFICTIELVELFGHPAENAAFLFSAIPDKDGLIYKRAVSMDKWERVKKYSLCFWFGGRR